LSQPKILALVLAGGEGSRLHPLTAERSKPAVPFRGRYRIVDFVLSNLVNSGIQSIYLLVQYKAQSLIEHLRKSWMHSSVVPGQFITVVPPQMRDGQEWFKGTADAVFQNRNLIELHAPDMVAVFGADHVYRMDVSQMLDFHLARSADISLAAIPVPVGQASAFGIIAVDPDGRVMEFQEKPDRPREMPGRPGYALASMGNYLFNTRVLKRALREVQHRGETDFGRHLLPRLLRDHRLYAYDFMSNRIPGVKLYEEQAYWRDVGTIAAYFDSSMDVLGPEPRFDLFNPQWPIHSSYYDGPVAKVMSGAIRNSVIAGGAVIKGGTIVNSILRREVFVEPDAELEDCIILDNVTIQRGCRLRRVIVDSTNSLPPGTQVGLDPAADQAHYHVDPSGIVVVPQGRSLWDTDSYFEGEL